MNTKMDRNRIVEAAEKFLKAGKLREAVAEYEKLAELDPSDIGILNTIGDLHIRLGRENPAIEAYQRVAREYEKRGLYSQALAIQKKIFRLKPDDPELALKLADLYGRQGFVSDAKDTYAKAADRLIREKNFPAAIAIYEKSARIDKEDLAVRSKLASLYKSEGLIEKYVDTVAEIAEKTLENGFPDKAEKILIEAQTLQPSNRRIITDLIEVYKKKNDRKKALQVVEQGLREDGKNPHLLNLLGNLHFEEGDFKNAEKAFSAILDDNPMNVNARIRLGRLHILKGDPDSAFKLLEPLVDNLVKKNREDQAVGLLGLILANQRIYLPALEKLAAILRSLKDYKRLEIVNRTILDELNKDQASGKTLAVLEELLQIRPDDEDLSEMYRKVKSKIGDREKVDTPEAEPEAEPEVEKKAEPETPRDDESLLIESTLSQADLYVKQGLVRNARRILENLRRTYPEDSRILAKLETIDKAQSQLDEEDIRQRVREASILEAQIREHRKRTEAPISGEQAQEEKISSGEIFSDISGIIPLDDLEAGGKVYYDLAEPLHQEQRMIQDVWDRQRKGLTIQFEKDLSQIVEDFKKDIQAEIPEDDADRRFLLGIAFMELGLIAEAIDEFLLSARDKERAMESYHALSRCHQKNKNYTEAEKCLMQAMKLAREGTDAHHALEFDLAALMEDNNKTAKALDLYKKVHQWNPGFRDVSGKIKRLEQAP